MRPYPLLSTSSRAPIVCLDPGHGGSDRDFTHVDPAMDEAPFDLEQAWALEAGLQQHRHEGES